MKLVVIIILKYITLVLGIFLFLGLLASKGAEDDSVMALAGICSILLSIYFQGEQNRNSK